MKDPARPSERVSRAQDIVVNIEIKLKALKVLFSNGASKMAEPFSEDALYGISSILSDMAEEASEANRLLDVPVDPSGNIINS